ncbi:hypothetical protein FN846DRAFT_887140 [Sphaerosporella brunnea]|uniref:Ubiquitin-like domain-containing protein n=1 Tax=Sphaerosporella brunnea TaxID=1250544 RepID=A0A5J5F6S5_9PEZI|nr:hypothetical protein FN846DRAFT_887140 [Sphaerosporella brunnea]
MGYTARGAWIEKARAQGRGAQRRKEQTAISVVTLHMSMSATAQPKMERFSNDAIDVIVCMSGDGSGRCAAIRTGGCGGNGASHNYTHLRRSQRPGILPIPSRTVRCYSSFTGGAPPLGWYGKCDGQQRALNSIGDSVIPRDTRDAIEISVSTRTLLSKRGMSDPEPSAQHETTKIIMVIEVYGRDPLTITVPCDETLRQLSYFVAHETGIATNKIFFVDLAGNTLPMSHRVTTLGVLGEWFPADFGYHIEAVIDE